ncbi:MAG: hypothetical protein HPY73_06785 [Methanomassiliicoccales archaeon]|nr:MAG: hypothetical protein HPY73_06785 [Methanomassiliicoccales archaeon]
MLDWKVLGKKTLPVGIQDTWESRIKELAAKKEDGEKFLALFHKADITYKFDTIRELHIFHLQMPPTTSMDELNYMKDYIQALRRAARSPMVSLEGKEQKSTVVISGDEIVNEYALRHPEYMKK